VLYETGIVSRGGTGLRIVGHGQGFDLCVSLDWGVTQNIDPVDAVGRWPQPQTRFCTIDVINHFGTKV